MKAVGYEIRDLIYESTNSLIYHALRRKDNKPVIIKMFRDSYPSPERIAWFKREFLITEGLQLEGVARAFSLEQVQDRWSIILEECEAQSLDLLELAGNLSLVDLLELALKITDALGQIHRNYIIHKDINPTNIILNAQTRELRLIDFGSSTVLSREATSFKNPNVLEGTLAYISPEQTGRVNRPVDYRTDFYSLGVTLYHLATGKLPFSTREKIELIHCHIAREPESPTELDFKIPPVLSQLILRLMAKNADDRYQTVYGLKADLERCLSQAKEKGNISSFPLGEADISDRFSIPERLYGRDWEIENLLSTFNKVKAGGNELLLIQGDPGIGKSALVREIFQSITLSRGFYVSGKFDQYQRDVPYDSLIQAFTSLVEQLLTESGDRVAIWREKILKALGSVAGVLVDIIPEIALIIGDQPAVEALPPMESQNRVDLVFREFTSVFASAEHPLVLFLDDLQWVDGATLRMLKSLMETGCPYLMVIGAYRDKEVEESHPLALTIDSLEKLGCSVSRIELGPPAEPHLNQLVAETLHQQPGRVKSLTRLIMDKTGGNPFFFNEFLKSLYSEGLISFDVAHGCWSWDLSRIKKREIADNVVTLMSNKLLELPEKTLNLLKIAACVGNRFELGFLARLSDMTLKDAAGEIWSAVDRGLVVPLSHNYQLAGVEDEGLSDTLEVHYKFVHDRIQHAVYMLNSDEERQPIHYKIGRQLLTQLKSGVSDRRVFDVVNQLNTAEAPKDSAAREELAGLNRNAGVKALQSAAYQPAYHYLKTGIALFEGGKGAGEMWKNNHDLALDLYTRTAEAAYLNEDYDEMNRLVDIVLKRGKTLLEKVPAFEVRIQALVLKNDPLQAIETGLKVLKLLGLKLPRKPKPKHINEAIAAATTALDDRSPEDLLALPPIQDVRQMAVMRILETIFLPCLISVPELSPIIASKQVMISIEYGNADESPIAYGNFGLTLSGTVKKYELAHNFGKLALRLLDHMNTNKYRARTTVMNVCNLAHWKEHITERAPDLLEAYPSGLETGDFDFAAGCLASYAAMIYLGGVSLDEVARRYRNADRAMVRLGQELYRHWLKIWWQSVLNWMGRTEDPLTLVGEVYDEHEMLPVHEKANDLSALFIINYNKAMLAYHFAQYKGIEAYLPSLTNHNQHGGPLGPLAVFYASLIRLALCAKAKKAKKKKLICEVREQQREMADWVELAPMNYRHKYCLVEAELARIEGRCMEAREFYDQAVELASDAGYINEEALAFELAARFYIEREQFRLARHYMKNARYNYDRWGARAKVLDLEARYPQILNRETWEAEKEITTMRTDSTEFDLAGVLQASQAIARELVPARMLSRVMEVLLEIAGARKGFLIKKKDDQWLVVVEGRVDGETGVLDSEPPVEGFENLSGSVVNFVLKTHKPVVLDDAARDEKFGGDTYIQANKSKSILCLPILHQGDLLALLYLENELGIGVFTEDRLEILQLLSAQTAISIENAALYEDMERKVQERTAALNDRNEQILASIRYAKQIQSATLPTQELGKVLPQSFVVFLPRDLVSGDFYWIHRVEGSTFLVVVDCTGHGVPGALMSMVGSTLLDKIIRGQGLTDPAQILEQLHYGVREILWREVETKANVGMDICLCRIDDNPRQVVFSGAVRPLFHVLKDEAGKPAINVVKGSRRSVDGLLKKSGKFTNHVLQVQSGDMIYLTTDGYPDQKGRNQRKIGTTQFKKMMLNNALRPLEEQEQYFLQELEAHRGLEPQRDDITIVGVRF